MHGTLYCKYKPTRYLIPSFEVELVICLEDPLKESSRANRQSFHTRIPRTDGTKAVKEQHKLFTSQLVETSPRLRWRKGGKKLKSEWEHWKCYLHC